MEVKWCSDHGLPHSSLLDWDAEDRAKLTAWLMHDAQQCQMCGTSEWEWEDDWFAYEPVVRVCRGCQVKEGASDDDEPMPPGANVALVPRKVAEGLRSKPKAPPRRSR